MTTEKLFGNSWRVLRRLAGSLGIAIPAAVFLLAVTSVRAEDFRLQRGFNEEGNILIADQFNNLVIRINHQGHILASYGLPLAGGGAIGNNAGYDLRTTQRGLYSPYDAKIVGDFTGLTPPFADDDDGR